MFTLKIKQRSFFVIIALTVAFVIGQVAFSATSQGSWSPTPTKSWSKPAATPTKNWNSWQPTPTKSWSKPVATPTKNWNSWQPTPTKSWSKPVATPTKNWNSWQPTPTKSWSKPVATPTKNWSNKPTTTPIVNNGKPEILSFEAKVVRSYPNGDDEIEMKWETKNVAGLKMVVVIDMLNFYQEIAYEQVGVRVGSTKFIYKNDIPSLIHVTLHILDSNGSDLVPPRTVELFLGCQYSYFFDINEYERPPGCPSAPATNEKAAYQKFEHGFMVWIEKEKMIKVYSEVQFEYQEGDETIPYGPYTVRFYQDTWDSSQPASDPTLQPPAGLYQPQYGFGKLWRTSKYSYIRRALGWATQPEISYTKTSQRSAYGPRQLEHFSTPENIVFYVYSDRYYSDYWSYLEKK